MQLTPDRSKANEISSKTPARSIKWTTKLVDRWLYEEQHSIPHTIPSPFDKNIPGLRKQGLSFVHTSEELEEFKKCAKDIVYFVETYCVTQTDDGYRKVKLREYQKRILRDLQKYRYNVWVASRQIGKTTTSGFFMTWYITFHKERNCLVTGNKQATALEILNKMDIAYTGLPFFLKPGIVVNNKGTFVFDNGCRVMGVATSETPGLGFTIHLLYCDEFAHVPRGIIGPFWRSVFPTLSASDVSRCIVTSTFNGMNKFWDMYDKAIKGKSQFHPIRVDWWEVPGRDEAWKKAMIEDLGTEDDFYQEFGNIPLSNKTLLLPPDVLRVLNKYKKKFVWKNIPMLDDAGINYDDLKWDEKFDDFEFDPNLDKFIISIDTAEGIGKDFSVINIFRIAPFSLSKISKATKYSSEIDFFRLVQVGLFRNNSIAVDELAKMVAHLIFYVLGSENTLVIIEMNRAEGMIIHQRLRTYPDYYDEIILHTKHTIQAKHLSPGIKLNEQNKILYCRELKNLITTGKILLQEENSVIEASSFGINRRGRYSGLQGHDDIMMSTVNTTAFFGTPEFVEMVGDVFDNLPSEFQMAIDEKLRDFPVERYIDEGIDYSILNNL